LRILVSFVFDSDPFCERQMAWVELNLNVFPFDITKISQSLPECLNLRTRSFGIATPTSEKSYPGHFLRLLRLGWSEERKHE
jgi:hypothetical protein